jgi:hypothetical protein
MPGQILELAGVLLAAGIRLPTRSTKGGTMNGDNKKPSPVVEAWNAYQAAAARDPYSDETKRAHALYQRRLTAAKRARTNT